MFTSSVPANMPVVAGLRRRTPRCGPAHIPRLEMLSEPRGGGTVRARDMNRVRVWDRVRAGIRVRARVRGITS